MLQVKTVRIEVEGVPAAQGSMVRGPTGGMWHASKSLPQWRRTIVEAGEETMAGAEPFKDCAVNLAVVFRMRQLKKPKRDLPYVRPDLDKLIRAVGDALEGVVLADDAQIVSFDGTRKRYTLPGERPGASIEVTLIE